MRSDGFDDFGSPSAAPAGTMSWRARAGVLALGAVTLLGIAAWVNQLITGLGVTGM